MATLASAAPPAASSREAQPGTAPQSMHVVVVDDAAALQAHVPAWEQLAASALEPNAFHEPWMLLPALRSFAAGTPLLFLLVYTPNPTRPHGPQRLCGFFPLERRRRYKGLPLAHLRIWQHPHCALSTPLIRRDCAPECLAALFQWLAADQRGAALLELNFVAADGTFHHALVDFLNEHGRLTYEEETSTRALLRTNDERDGEAYLQDALSGGNRKKLRRQRRRLGELGRLETRVLNSAVDMEFWLDGFLQLEASGWKGRQGTALGVRDNEREFFRAAVRAAFERGSLMMLGLFLDGRPLAFNCNFLMGDGAVAFKIAFDETYARFSPGVQLELDGILLAHARPGLRWMDSCTVSRHFMIDRLWRDRRVVRTVLISTGSRGGDFAVSLLPGLRWLRRIARRHRPGETS